MSWGSDGPGGPAFQFPGVGGEEGLLKAVPSSFTAALAIWGVLGLSFFLLGALLQFIVLMLQIAWRFVFWNTFGFNLQRVSFQYPCDVLSWTVGLDSSVLRLNDFAILLPQRPQYIYFPKLHL